MGMDTARHRMAIWKLKLMDRRLVVLLEMVVVVVVAAVDAAVVVAVVAVVADVGAVDSEDKRQWQCLVSLVTVVL